jgi:hypothetical protein
MERMSDNELIALFRAGAAVGSVNWQIADRIAALTAERDALALQLQRADDLARSVDSFMNWARPYSGIRVDAHKDAVSKCLSNYRALRCATEGAGNT